MKDPTVKSGFLPRVLSYKGQSFRRSYFLNGTQVVWAGPKQDSVAEGGSYAPPLDWPQKGTLIRVPKVVRFFYDPETFTGDGGQDSQSGGGDPAPPGITCKLISSTQFQGLAKTPAYDEVISHTVVNFDGSVTVTPSGYTNPYGFPTSVIYASVPSTFFGVGGFSEITFEGTDPVGYLALTNGFVQWKYKKEYTYKCGKRGGPFSYSTVDSPLSDSLLAGSDTVAPAAGSPDDTSDQGGNPDGSGDADNGVWKDIGSSLELMPGTYLRKALFVNSFSYANDNWAVLAAPPYGMPDQYLATETLNLIVLSRPLDPADISGPLLRISTHYPKAPKYATIVYLDLDGISAATKNIKDFSLDVFRGKVNVAVEAMQDYGWSLGEDVGYKSASADTFVSAIVKFFGLR